MLNKQFLIKKYSLLIVAVFGILAIATALYFSCPFRCKEKNNQTGVNITKEQHLEGGGFKSSKDKFLHFTADKFDNGKFQKSQLTIQNVGENINSAQSKKEEIEKIIRDIIKENKFQKVYISK